MAFTIENDMTDGIERISYYPQERKYNTEIIFQHGAWHGAWCWKWWQELFAEWGWVSHAHSLPSHGKSEHKRNIRFCHLGYYRDALAEQVNRCDAPPVVIGHSMGGAITQWYLTHIGDLPAAVLLASMPLYDSVLRYILADPAGMTIAAIKLHGRSLVDSPEKVAKLFLTEGAIMSKEDLHAHMDAESLLVPLQLNPLTWHPRKNPDTPMLVMAAEKDSIFTIREEEKLAEHYGADYYLIKNTAHNAMMEHSYQESAQYIQDWLLKQGIN